MIWLLTICLSSLAITGCSFIDDKIWSLAFIGIGSAAYAVVGFLYSTGLLAGKKAGKEAYITVYAILLITAFGVYSLFARINNWINDWPLLVKIIIFAILTAVSVLLLFLIIRKRKLERVKKK